MDRPFSFAHTLCCNLCNLSEELKDLKIRYKKAYRFYRKELSNFQTVMRDTNNSIVTAVQYDYNCMSYALDVYDDWLALNAFEHSYCDDASRRQITNQW